MPRAESGSRILVVAYTIYTISLQEIRGGMSCGMGILPMIHGRDARATFTVHAVGL